MGSIGRRWKGSDVRSRAVLIARKACAYAPLPQGRGAQQVLFIAVVRKSALYLRSVIPTHKTCPIIFMSCPERTAPGHSRNCRTPCTAAHGNVRRPVLTVRRGPRRRPKTQVAMAADVA